MNPQVWCKTPLMKQIHYGELHEILVCEVPPSKTLNTQSASTHLLTLMLNCQVYTNAAVTPAMLSFPKQLRLSPSCQCHQFVDASLSTLLWVSDGP